MMKWKEKKKKKRNPKRKKKNGVMRRIRRGKETRKSIENGSTDVD